MAKIVTKNPGTVLPFSVQFNRGYKAPLDLHSTFKTLALAEAYLTSYAEINVYDGQLISVGENDNVKLYIVKSTVNGQDITYRLDEIGQGGLTPEETANLASKSDLNNYIKKDQIGNIFNFSGSYNTVLDLPVASADLLGKVYNIRNAFTIDEPVLSADGTPVLDKNNVYTTETRNYPAGTNVVCYKLEYTTPVLNEQGQPTTDPLSGEPVVDTHVYYIWDALGGVTDWDWEEV